MNKREKKGSGKQHGVGTMLLQLQASNIKPGSLFVDLDGEEFTDDGRGHVLHNGIDEVGKIQYSSGVITFDREFMDGGTHIIDTL